MTSSPQDVRSQHYENLINDLMSVLGINRATLPIDMIGASEADFRQFRTDAAFNFIIRWRPIIALYASKSVSDAWNEFMRVGKKPATTDEELLRNFFLACDDLIVAIRKDLDTHPEEYERGDIVRTLFGDVV